MSDLATDDRVRVKVSGRTGTVERAFDGGPDWLIRARVQLDGDPPERTIVFLAQELEYLNDEMDRTERANATGREGVSGPPLGDTVDRDAAEHPTRETTAPVAPVAVATGEITIVMTDGSRRHGRVVWSAER